ncbi:MAG TPA: 30S ribosomal protein S17 [Thermoplasmata archaeon]|nr:30S ribosomal protein S17 [Thermoplasmata archaeon]
MTPTRKSAAPRARDIGLDVRAPKARCDDRHCPFHGRLPLRGQLIEGTVVSTAMQRTAVIERTLLHFVPKYERYEKRRRRYLAHAPPCLNVPVGHRVRIAETRPLSKLVSFCIVADLGEAARRVRGEEAAGVEPTPPAEESA